MKPDLPKYDDFLLPTLQVLDALGGSATTDEINEGLIERFELGQQQLDSRYPKSGALMVPDRMSWARSYLKYPRFVSNLKRGVWVLTEAGREALARGDDQVRAVVAQAAYADTLARKTQKEIDFSGPNADPGTVEEEAWSEKLLRTLQAVAPAAFERLAQRILRESGFVKVEVTGKSGDGGIDGTGVLRVNLISFHVLFQCKRYTGSVSAGAVRDFRGAMQGRADKGLIITTGSFTADARKEATRDGAPAIDLIDGEALCLLLKDLGLGVSVRPVVREEINVDDAFFDSI